MRIGIIRTAGKVTGYKSPEDRIERGYFADRELKSKLTREQLRFADHALEFRARWMHESVGYGDSSCDIKEGDRLPAGSTIPIGCEIPEIVARAIHALDLMMKTNREYVLILNKVTLSRKRNENIAGILKKTGYSADQYRAARNRFASFLSNN